VEPSLRQAALANRATCHLQLQQFEAAAQDCDVALQELLEAAGRPCSLDGLHAWALEQRQGRGGGCGGMDWGRAARLLGRRGAALGHLKRYRAAEDEYRCAAHICRALLGEEEQARLMLQDMERMAQLAAAAAA
jgi:hypothetical protein